MAALTVVFDLDGTLVDTAPDLIETLNVVLTREGLAPVAYAAARDMIGGGARKMIEAGLKLEGRTLSDDVVDRMFADFISYYAEHIADHSRPFPGLDAALDRLAARGCRFAVCTNKLEGLSKLLLDALGLSRRFEAICGQDTFGIQKPDPAILHRTIEAAGGVCRLCGHGRRFRHRHRHRPGGSHSGGGGRFRLQRDAGQGAFTRPPDQPFRRARRRRFWRSRRRPAEALPPSRRPQKAKV